MFLEYLGSGWVAGIVLFWIGMLGLLWRRSLLGMLVGVLFGWISVALVGLAYSRVQPTPEQTAEGAALILIVCLVGALQIALGLSLVFSRISRRGTLDAQDAGLLEG